MDNLRQEVAEATATQLELARLGAPPSATGAYEIGRAHV